MNLKMLADENYHQYIWRLDNLIKSGKYRNWKEITPIVNIELFGLLFLQVEIPIAKYGFKIALS